MTERKLILIMGVDETILHSRGRILEQAGFAVLQAETPQDVRQILKDRQIALLLLCHTLSSEACQKAIAAAHLTDPNIITVLLATFSRRPVLEESDVVVHQMSGPQKLVDTIRKILH